jgi:predicted amidophosphoribosyltransferase
MLNNCILRLSETSTQTKKKKFERWQNVEGVFKINNPSILENKHVLLVDDVITTGATIDAAWQTIKDIEGIKISVISIAFAAKNF